MNCEMIADILVHRYFAFAEMALLSRRPELGLLCRTARDSGQAINTAVIQSVLPGTSAPGAANILSWCCMLGICDSHGSLTSLGYGAAEDDQVPVPEQGVYEFWVAEHPLIGRRILHLERRCATRDARFDRVSAVPIEPKRDREFASVLNNKERWVFRGLPGNSSPLQGASVQVKGTCRIRWKLEFDTDQNQWRIEGGLDGTAYQQPGEAVELDGWGLFANWAQDHLRDKGRWDPAKRCFMMAFDGLAAPEQESFRKSFPLEKVTAGKYGGYGNVTVQDVAIGPQSAKDAICWANARLERRLTETEESLCYRTRGNVRRLFIELVEGTPLEPLSPTLAAHDVLLDRYRKSPYVFWSLAAPLDLAPAAPLAEELSAMAVGQELPIAAPLANTVRVPFRGGWSLLDLAGRLVAGARPRRFLLCDRYVMNDTQRAGLSLFSDTLRLLCPDASLDLATQTEGQDKASFDALRKILGKGQLRGYHEVFGSLRRTHPHDRYLLVDTYDQGRFGWQMSNSPLDGRHDGKSTPTPQTPLLWRDFSATRLRQDEIPLDLGRWFQGGIA